MTIVRDPIPKCESKDRAQGRFNDKVRYFLNALIDAGIITIGPGGPTIPSSGARYYNEVPSGTINGVNAAFTLANTPASGTERVYVNGLRQHVGAGNDYTISGAVITFEAGSIPLTGSSLLADYDT